MQTPPALPYQPPTPAPAQSGQRYNPWAIVSASFGASTILGTWCLGGLVAIVTGHVARNQIKKTGEAGDGLALAGLIAGYVSIGLFLLLILAYISFFGFFLILAITHPGPAPTPTPGL